MKKIAFCLYGQPREYLKGYHTNRILKERYPEIGVDYYYHTWIKDNLAGDQYYEASEWRNISSDELKIGQDTIKKINDLYHPVDYSYDEPRNFSQDKLKDSLCYLNTVNPKKISNINNILSQMYSRNKVRDLLSRNLINNKYDFVISTRFDYTKELTLNLNEIDISKVYVSDSHHPRKIFPDNFILTGVDNYLDIFNMYNNLEKIVNNKTLEIRMKENGENLEFNAEELLFANFLYYFKNIDNVNYTNAIPGFP